MYSKILVPLDASTVAEAALPHVAGNARAHDAAVHLLQVIDPADMTSPLLRNTLELLTSVGEPDRTAALEAWAQSGEEYLADVARRLREQGVREVTSHVVRGNPYELIGREVTEAGCDLVIIATHGRGGFGRALTGSVADHLVRHTPDAAVLVVRPTPER